MLLVDVPVCITTTTHTHSHCSFVQTWARLCNCWHKWHTVSDKRCSVNEWCCIMILYTLNMLNPNASQFSSKCTPKLFSIALYVSCLSSKLCAGICVWALGRLATRERGTCQCLPGQMVHEIRLERYYARSGNCLQHISMTACTLCECVDTEIFTCSLF